MVCEAEKRPSTLVGAVRYFADPEVCERYIRSIRWPDGQPVCEKCGSVNVRFVSTRRRYQCRDCKKWFSLITGTILEATHLTLEQWLVATWMIVNCRNGVSSCEIARTIGCHQQSAWHLLHRVRHVMQQSPVGKIGENRGAVECDSTFVGGQFKFMSMARQERARKNGRPHGKCVVHAIRDRASSTVRASVVGNISLDAVKDLVRENVERGAHVYTDGGREYRWISYADGYRHEVVNHSIGEYVRGPATTNGCENFFNCLRRGLKGTYVHVAPEHLAAYVDEQVYRFNAKKLGEWDRFDGVMQMIVGKRLSYSTLTDGATR